MFKTHGGKSFTTLVETCKTQISDLLDRLLSFISMADRLAADTADEVLKTETDKAVALKEEAQDVKHAADISKKKLVAYLVSKDSAR